MKQPNCLQMEREAHDKESCSKHGSYGDERRAIIIGVCAMEKKSRSKQMREMLRRLEEFPNLHTIIFPEKCILENPVSAWPPCDCLISFYSNGFPLDKARDYARLRKPYIVNDLEMQNSLHDRKTVYKILENANVEVPRYIIVKDQKDLEEFEDHITVNGVDFPKPFVEKPLSGENHNIHMYFPSTAGGGTQKLFRKTGDQSSVYTPESTIRRDGEYLYEEFLPTDGTDVKVYAVGPNYAHAEARKSPGLDGKVRRDGEGKEIRYPVILTRAEKIISRKVCLAFKQTVCGFDLLRANGKSYVSDVNGFSFVKTSGRYYHDAARILAHMIFRHFGMPVHFPIIRYHSVLNKAAVPLRDQGLELRCMVAVIRHGDRTPKQKIKVTVSQPIFHKLFKKYAQEKSCEVKLKTPNQLQEVLDIVRELLSSDPNLANREKFEQMKFVLEMKGRFSGINRKVELKVDDRAANDLELVMKWGGELTSLGIEEAQNLGQFFRHLYPEGQSSGSESQGLGLLRLHSTFRHDLKIYASDEGRVQMTAAAFAKGFLALEGELPPILVHMVKSSNSRSLFTECYAAHDNQKQVKSQLYEAMLCDRELTEEDKDAINPCKAVSVATALDAVGNPLDVCRKVACLMKQLISQIKIVTDGQVANVIPLYHHETWEFLERRWRKHLNDFNPAENEFNLSRIPDIYDSIKFDVLHNAGALKFLGAEELFAKAQLLANIIIPQEYGLTRQDKVEIGSTLCKSLLHKIREDLQRNLVEEAVHRLDPMYSAGVATPERHVRTRLYFASETHIHSLLIVLLNAAPWQDDPEWQRAVESCSKISELNFLAQLVIMMYEDPQKDPACDDRFQVEIHFSPGVWGPSFEKPKMNETDLDDSAFIPQCPQGDLTDKVSHDGISSCTSELENPKPKEGYARFRSASLSRAPELPRRSSLSPARDAKIQAGAPAIRPLTTLHNELSYVQVDKFLASVINA